MFIDDDPFLKIAILFLAFIALFFAANAFIQVLKRFGYIGRGK